MEVTKIGTFKGHLRKMLLQLYLWTSQINPEKLCEELKNDLCFSYDTLKFEKLPSNEEGKEYYKLLLDFGDLQVEYVLLFKQSPQTKRWVLSEIQM